MQPTTPKCVMDQSLVTRMRGLEVCDQEADGNSSNEGHCAFQQDPETIFPREYNTGDTGGKGTVPARRIGRRFASVRLFKKVIFLSDNRSHALCNTKGGPSKSGVQKIKKRKTLLMARTKQSIMAAVKQLPKHNAAGPNAGADLIMLCHALESGRRPRAQPRLSILPNWTSGTENNGGTISTKHGQGGFPQATGHETESFTSSI